MRAAVYHGPRDVRVETRPRPRAGPDQLLVEVSVAAICGTDASEYVDGPHLIPAGGDPIVLGHEFTGRVVEVGAAVAGFARGDRVVSGAGVWRGECDSVVHARPAGRRRPRRDADGPWSEQPAAAP